MKREIQKLVKERKQEAIDLIRYASIKNGRNMKNRPTIEHVTEILSQKFPYHGEKPSITNISVMGYHKNSIIKTAYFRIDLSDGRSFKITAYQHLKGRTQEEREADKTATFPSGLFNCFHDEIV